MKLTRKKSTAIAVLSWIVAGISIATGGSLVYLVAGGGPDDPVCTDGVGILGFFCVDRICVYIWLIIQSIVTILLAACLSQCKGYDEENCKLRCWELYGFLTAINIIWVVVLCSVPGGEPF
jgi:hypothetical protein